MYIVNETPDSACHAKAQSRGQATFTLVEQDRTSPETICFWIMRNIETCPADKLRKALEDAIKWREFPNRKAAD